jgi:tetratricopeptide (TPR) repeat protein
MFRRGGKPLPTQSRAMLFVFFLGLLVRLCYLAEYSSKPYFGYPILDSRVWVDQAQNIAAGKSLTRDFYFRPPVYSYYLAAFFKLFGDRAYFAVPLVQLILGAFFCVIVFKCTLRCWNLVAAVSAGVLCALYGPLIFYEAEILSDSLALFFTGMFFLYWLRGVDTRRLQNFVIAGIFAGIGALTRPNAILILAAFCACAAALGLVEWRQARKDAVAHPEYKPVFWTRAAIFAAAPALLFITLQMAHSAKLGDRTFIASQGGVNFWIGNHKGANGLNCIFPHVAEGVSTERYKDAAERFSRIGYLLDKYGEHQALRRFNEQGERIMPHVLSSYWYGKGLDFLRQNPREAVHLYLVKVLGLLNNYEVRNNKEFYFVHDYLSRVLRYVPFSFGWLVTFGFAGLYFSVRSEKRRLLGWLILAEAILCASVVMFFVGGRLRVPVLAAAFTFAGIGVERIIFFAKHQKWIPLSATAAGMALCSFISFYSWPQVDFRYAVTEEPGHGIYATSHYGLEWAYLASSIYDSGNYTEALKAAKKSLSLDSTLPFAYQIAGNSLERMGKAPEAATYYRDILKYEPDNAIALNNLGAVAEKTGNIQAAVEFYEYSIINDPYMPRALTNLAALYLRAGNREMAKRLVKRALQVSPSFDQAIAVLQKAEGRVPKRSMQEAPYEMELDTPLRNIPRFNDRRALPELLRASMESYKQS